MTRAKIYSVVTDWLIIGLFGALLFVPLLLAVTEPRQVYSPTEKRFLAKFPEFHLKDLGATAFARAVDRYYQDHFGLREFLIHRYHREVNKRFDVASAADVVLGKDGWLFYSGEKVLDDLDGRFPLSREQIYSLAARIRGTRSWLGEQGIFYLFTVAPDKQSIYPEFLPDVYGKARGASRLDQALSVLNRDPASKILDLRPVLLRNKDGQRLYDKTDTHWNPLGAYCGFRELMREVTAQFPGEDAHDYFSIGGQWQRDPAGDLAQLSGRSDSLWEMRPVVMAWLRAKEKKLSDPLREILLLEQLQPYVTVRAGRKLKVLVLHDSFMNTMKPFLSESFAEVLYIWKYFDRDVEKFLSREVMQKVLDEFKPDIVIDEVVERHLDWLIPNESPENASSLDR